MSKQSHVCWMFTLSFCHPSTILSFDSPPMTISVPVPIFSSPIILDPLIYRSIFSVSPLFQKFYREKIHTPQTGRLQSEVGPWIFGVQGLCGFYNVWPRTLMSFRQKSMGSFSGTNRGFARFCWYVIYTLCCTVYVCIYKEFKTKLIYTHISPMWIPSQWLTSNQYIALCICPVQYSSQ